jgi:hypothetical protein
VVPLVKTTLIILGIIISVLTVGLLLGFSGLPGYAAFLTGLLVGFPIGWMWFSLYQVWVKE